MTFSLPEPDRHKAMFLPTSEDPTIENMLKPLLERIVELEARVVRLDEDVIALYVTIGTLTR